MGMPKPKSPAQKKAIFAKTGSAGMAPAPKIAAPKVSTPKMPSTGGMGMAGVPGKKMKGGC